MRYAVIADVHGNLYALEAGLTDAKNQGADMYLFLGDYYCDLPFSNECAELVRATVPAIAIGGNKEQRLAYAPDSGWENYLQMRLLMDNLSRMTPENFAYLTQLPPSLDITAEDGAAMQLRHNSPIRFRKERLSNLHSSLYNADSHEEYLLAAKAEILSRSDVVADIEALSEGCVHMFAHNHVQFHA
ncbi:MAG: metallophosphoesterase, partial [Oscillospiraceae bacterium]|nr:metallophosphoesterase [Oscillospiraceae bacterium]